MARQTFYITKDQPNPLYKTRMLQAGEELTLSASAHRLFSQLGVDMSEDAPKKARAAAAEPVAETPAPAEQPAPDPSPEPTPTARKAPAKKAARRKKS